MTMALTVMPWALACYTEAQRSPKAAGPDAASARTYLLRTGRSLVSGALGRRLMEALRAVRCSSCRPATVCEPSRGTVGCSGLGCEPRHRTMPHDAGDGFDGLGWAELDSRLSVGV